MGSLAIHGFVCAVIDIDILIQPESPDKAYKIPETKCFDIRALDISFKERAVENPRVSKNDENGEVLSFGFLLVTPQLKTLGNTREN